MIEIVPPEQNYLGKSYSEWASEWWKWVCGIRPDDRHPLNVADDTEDIATGEGLVHFLAGTFGHFGRAIRRKCMIPAGAAIYFPVVNMICSQQEGDDRIVEGPTPESRLLKVARGNMDGLIPIQAKVDGVSIPDLWNYRVESSAFDLHLEDDNILRDKQHPDVRGDGLAVTTGYYILLKPLSIGKHEIYIRATGKPSPDHGTFDIEVTYIIEVTPEAK